MNRDLNAARWAKKDEFYTQLSDIEKEMPYYREHFQNKVVYCNCDDPIYSNFWRYFHLHFAELHLKQLIATCYDPVNPGYITEYTGGADTDIAAGSRTRLVQDGDFRSTECKEILKQADIVVTNAPFSLWLQYIGQLIQYDKKFIVLGNINVLTCKEFFPLIKENRVWLGASIHSGDREFRVPDSYPLNAAGWRIDDAGNKYIRVKGVRWFTNLDHDQRHIPLPLVCRYADAPEMYPRYDNYAAAINVDKTADIPADYMGIMGVPISFVDRFCPEQFEIVWQASGNTRASAPKDILNRLQYSTHPEDRGGCGVIAGKRKYGRIFIQRAKSGVSRSFCCVPEWEK